MNRDEQRIYDALRQQALPPGWTCEPEFAYRKATHLIAPKRSGGVVVKKWNVHVQLPGTGPASDKIEIGSDFKGRGWLDEIVYVAVKAAFTYADRFPLGKKMYIVGKLGTHASDRFQIGQRRKPIASGDRIYVRGTDARIGKWTRVAVDEIREVGGKPFYMLSL